MSNQKLTRRERGKQTSQQTRNTPANPVPSAADGHTTPEERRHFRLGWWSLLVFVCLGIVLEGMLAFKAPWYVNVGDNETHRMMLRLSHAHGTLLSVLNIAFAASLARLSLPAGARVQASRCLAAATAFSAPRVPRDYPPQAAAAAQAPSAGAPTASVTS